MALLDLTGLSYFLNKLNLKFAPLASPALTGTPTAPTPTSGDDSTKIATTAFVQDALAGGGGGSGAYLPLSGGELTGRFAVSLPTTTQADTAGEQPSIKLSSQSITTGTNPSSPEYWGIYFTDSSKLTNYDGRIAAVECAVRNTGQVSLNLGAYQFVSGKSAWAGSIISATILADGTSYVTLPTPVAGDNSNKAATTAWVNTKVGDYLPLAGGTMTGTITRNGTLAQSGSTTGTISIQNGTSATGGGGIWLYGASHATNPGKVRLQSYDSTNTTYRYFDVTGDGTAVTNCTSLSFITSGIISAASGGNAVSLYTGSNNFDGASLQMFGRTHSSYAGSFYLRASTKSSSSDSSGNAPTLVGKPDGTLTWNGTAISLSGHSHSYLPLSGGEITGGVNYKFGITKWTTTPSSTQYQAPVRMYDGDGTRGFALEVAHYNNAKTLCKLQVDKGAFGGSGTDSIAIGYDRTAGAVYTVAPTPPASDNSTQIATTAWVTTKAGNYLPLSGGTMTGAITRSGDIVINSVDTSWIRLNGGTSNSNGANLVLYGKSNTSYNGGAYLQVRDGTNTKNFIVKPDGTSTWDGTFTADSTITGSGLRATSAYIGFDGSFGRAYMDSYDSPKYLRITGGSSTTSGAYLDLQNSTNGNGTFSLVTRVSSTNTSLVGNGTTLTWGGTMKATSFQATSDSRKKHNKEIVQIDLSNLNAYQYIFEPDGKKHIGLIAQEVEKIIPEAVDTDEEGFKTLDYNSIVALLVSEINSLKKRVKDLEDGKRV